MSKEKKIPMLKHSTLNRERNDLKTKSRDEFLAFKQRRYNLFRVKNFADGGCPPDDGQVEELNAIKDIVVVLGGIKEFAISWDLSPKTGRVIMRDMSVWKAHEKFMDKAAVNVGEESAKLVKEK